MKRPPLEPSVRLTRTGNMVPVLWLRERVDAMRSSKARGDLSPLGDAALLRLAADLRAYDDNEKRRLRAIMK